MMSHLRSAPLLPPGFADLLPPEAEALRQARDGVLGTLRGWGYRLVRPPLLEADTALFAGAGDNRPGNTFRLPDPQSREMLALRADMTPQIGRIAATRLGSAPRPLRLCYAGEVLRTQASGHDPSRQMIQAGAELIGAASPQAVAEVILLAVASCQAMGLEKLSVDLCLPALVDDLVQTADVLPHQRDLLAAALQHKDIGALPQDLSAPVRALCAALFACVGPLAATLPQLADLPLLNDRQRVLVAEVRALAALLATAQLAQQGVTLTLDLSERQGFSFQSGVCFALFAPGLRGEIGRGGAYRIDLNGEPAAGFSVYLDPLLRALPKAAAPRLVLVPLGCGGDVAERLRQAGDTPVQSLVSAGPSADEARKLGCVGWWDGKTVQTL
jgi:ATP phosphoribosyltransferase regulatory subunit